MKILIHVQLLSGERAFEFVSPTLITAWSIPFKVSVQGTAEDCGRGIIAALMVRENIRHS